MQEAYYGIIDDIAKCIDWIDHQLVELGKHSEEVRARPTLELMRSYVISLRNKCAELRRHNEWSK